MLRADFIIIISLIIDPKKSCVNNCVNIYSIRWLEIVCVCVDAMEIKVMMTPKNKQKKKY